MFRLIGSRRGHPEVTEPEPRACTANVWAREIKFARNPVRQLLVPEGDLRIEDDDQGPWVCGDAGRWPARRGVAEVDADKLIAVLPRLATANVRVSWSGPRELLPPSVVTQSFADAIGFRSPGEAGS